MNRLIANAAAQYQGKDRENFLRFVQQEPMVAAQLRAPLYEDKVVDFLFGKAELTERKGTREQLEADLESEEGHVHGPGCGHDIAQAKPPKATKATKPATKAKAAAKPVPEEPAKGPVETGSAKPKPAKPLKDAPAAKPAETTGKAAKAEGKLPTKKASAAKAEEKPAKRVPTKKK
jgi:trigger factor